MFSNYSYFNRHLHFTLPSLSLESGIHHLNNTVYKIWSHFSPQMFCIISLSNLQYWMNPSKWVFHACSWIIEHKQKKIKQKATPSPQKNSLISLPLHGLQTKMSLLHWQASILFLYETSFPILQISSTFVSKRKYKLSNRNFCIPFPRHTIFHHSLPLLLQ